VRTAHRAAVRCIGLLLLMRWQLSLEEFKATQKRMIADASEIRRLKARIADLEQELSSLRSAPMVYRSSDAVSAEQAASIFQRWWSKFQSK